MVNAIYESQLSPQARQFLKKTGQPQPKYFCSSCSNLKNGNYCECFHRPVDAGYNRCFNHTNYKPVTVAFKAPENLEEIVRKEEKQIA